ANAKFNIYNTEDKLVDSLVTNENGTATSKELPLGKYIVRETEAPEGYVIDEEEIEVEIKYENQTTPIVYSELDITNTEIRGDIEITKKDISTGEPLPNTMITVYDKEGNEVETKVTDDKGV